MRFASDLINLFTGASAADHAHAALFATAACAAILLTRHLAHRANGGAA